MVRRYDFVLFVGVFGGGELGRLFVLGIFSIWFFGFYVFCLVIVIGNFSGKVGLNEVCFGFFYR